MPYIFPNADVFVGLVLAAIVGLVIARRVVSRNRRARRDDESD